MKYRFWQDTALLSAVLLSGLLLTASAGRCSEKQQSYLEFLRSVFLQSEYDRLDFIEQADDYLFTYAGDSLCAEIEWHRACAYDQAGDKEAGLIHMIRTQALYATDSLVRAERPAFIERLRTARDYRKRVDLIISRTAKRDTGAGFQDRYFSFIKFLHSLGLEAVQPWIIVFARDYQRLYRQDPRLDQILYWSALACRETGQDKRALLLFELIGALYPHSVLIPAVLYENARLQQHELDNDRTAMQLYARIADTFPLSSYAADSRMHLARLHTSHKEYTRGIESFRRLVHQYPDAQEYLASLAFLRAAAVRLLAPQR